MFQVPILYSESLNFSVQKRYHEFDIHCLGGKKTTIVEQKLSETYKILSTSPHDLLRCNIAATISLVYQESFFF